MRFSIDNLFGVHESALKLRAQRSEVIASNIANADTPGYKARDIDFSTALKQVQSGQPIIKLMSTNSGHISDSSSLQHDGMRFRVPFQAALDGNTVESQVEQAAFAKNAIEYQATLTFLEGRISNLMQAIKGD